MRRHEVMEALRRVEREHDVARAAVDSVLRLASRDPSQIASLGIDWQSLRDCTLNLERTYLVRLFAVFEEHVREFWASEKRRSKPRTEDLLNATAARRKIDAALMFRVHAVREYRNTVVHGGAASLVSLRPACSLLCQFIGWLPPEW